MWEMLTWWRPSRSPDVARTMTELQADSLRFFVGLAAAAYLAWHFLSLIANGLAGNEPARVVRLWALFPIVMASLGLTVALLRRDFRLACGWFLASALLAITAAAWLLEAPQATLLYALLALAAVVLVHPLAGLAVVGLASGLLGALRAAGLLALLGDEHLIATSSASLAVVAVAWALGRQLVTAVDWSYKSYAEAARNAHEARVNRGELAQALKQLDYAYYRLQRANAALELAWKAAETAERSRAEFVTNVSHELRTPLNLIVGFSELILTAPESYGVALPAAYRGDLNAIYRSAQHLLTLTNDVIDLARVGMGRLALVREPVDIAQIMHDARDVIRPYIEAKRLWLRVEVAPDLPILQLDRLRIRQVLLNLLTNAARFTERGGVTISARQADGDVLVRVVDTGKGIAPEELPKMFTEFFSSGATGGHPRADLGGVGLGLPLSKRFVELHGGRIGVESRVGVGTTFWFTLPAVQVDLPAPTDSRRRRGGRGGAEERRLVLVSADSQLAQFLRRHLGGWTMLAVPDLSAAIATAVDERALAILADLDDHEAAARDDLPVPLFRLPLPQAERLAAELGASAYLVKPITRAQLHAAIAGLGRPIRTVLIVDDDPSFVRLLTRLLRTARPALAYEAHSAHNGREALALMETLRPDVVLLDLVMPEMDGRAVLAAMRQRAALAETPVILISAQDQLQARLPLRGQMTLVNPDGFGLEELLNAVEALLNVLAPPRRYLTPAGEAPP
jgi:signal transduction histidine kinase/CheY-like chemotaxis protein